MISTLLVAIALSTAPAPVGNPFDHNDSLRSPLLQTPPSQVAPSTPSVPSQNEPLTPSRAASLLRTDLEALCVTLSGTSKGATVTIGEVRASPQTGMVLAHIDVTNGTDSESAVYLLMFDPKARHFTAFDYFVLFNVQTGSNRR